MATFTDKAGRAWEVEVLVGLLPKLREAGFDVAKAGTDPRAFESLGDPDTFGRVLWVLVGPQAEPRGVDADGLLMALNGPRYFAAVDAVVEAVTDFSHRPAVASALKERLPAVMRAAEEKAIAAIRSGSTASAGSSPGSPAASTPDGTPSAT